jgi:phosphatidate cytidylyltransferase
VSETPITPPSSMASDLKRRVPSAIAMILLALGATWYGSFPFLLFWAVAALIVWYEWAVIVRIRHKTTVLALGFFTIAIAAVLVSIHFPVAAFGAIAAGAVLAIVLAGDDDATRLWSGAGLIYAGLAFLPVILLREDVQFGFQAVLWLYAVVWLTDIAAYFAGRFIGGPKLAPAISPKKTWSGAIGGTLFGVIGGIGVAAYASGRIALMHIAVALAVSVFSQAGDIFESFVKRKFGKKDSSGILPGHGGVMDRIDGFIAGAALALLIGVANSGTKSPAAGLLQW